jgi:hypothetical protein
LWRKVGTYAHEASDVVVPGVPGATGLLFDRSPKGRGKNRGYDEQLTVFIEPDNMPPADGVYPLIYELFGPSELRVSPSRKGGWLSYAAADLTVALTFNHPGKTPDNALFNGLTMGRDVISSATTHPARSIRVLPPM